MTGNFFTAYGSMIKVGTKGQGDILGIRAKDGKMLSIEVKVGPDKLRPEQTAWKNMVLSMGGLAIECRNVEDVEAIL